MPLPLVAGLYGLLAAAGLVLGALVGLKAAPSRSTVAVVMAFGSGTLLSAVAFDLCEEAYRHGGPWVVLAGFAAGGLAFVLADSALASRGAFLRREGTRDAFLRQKKEERARDILSRLSGISVVRSLPPAEVQAIVPYVQERTFAPGEVIVTKGEEGDALYLIVEGEVEVSDQGATVAALGEGSAFGEMALLSGEPRNATVTARSAVKAYRIARDDFQHLVSHAPALAESIERLLEERMDARAVAGDAHAAETWRHVARAHLGRHVSALEERALMEQHDSSSAPLAIFLGALVDGVPECLVIGASMVGGAAPSLSFLTAVFLSNFPEAMSSATGMTRVGFSSKRIIGMWCGLAIVSGLAALLGNVLLAQAAPATLALAEAVAGGGILALLSNTMMPEAFEMGGRRVAFATIAGFLIAFLLAMLGSGEGGHEAAALCVSLASVLS